MSDTVVVIGTSSGQSEHPLGQFVHEGRGVLAKEGDVRDTLDVLDHSRSVHGKLVNVLKTACGGVDIDHGHGGNLVDYDGRHS